MTLASTVFLTTFFWIGHVDMNPATGRIVGEFRKGVLETLGCEKALYVLSRDTNPRLRSRHEYLFFLDALHTYLVLNHPQWVGGETKDTAPEAQKLTAADPKPER